MVREAADGQGPGLRPWTSRRISSAFTGRVNDDGTVNIWGITSTVSGNGDQGADPNKLVTIADRLAATSATGEHFTTLRTARYGEVLRGVSFTPGTEVVSCDDRRSDDRECDADRDDDHDRR